MTMLDPGIQYQNDHNIMIFTGTLMPIKKKPGFLKSAFMIKTEAFV